MVLLSVAGCKGCKSPTDGETGCVATAESPCGTQTYGKRDNATLYGALADEGYGTALAWKDGALWVGAPFDPAGGRLYREDALSRTGPAFLGSSVVATDSAVLVGGDGRVEDATGAVELEQAGTGGVIAALGARWITRSAAGAVWDDGTAVTFPSRPDSLAVAQAGGIATVAAGFAFGDTALEYNGITAGREALDEAGWAILPFDVDGDGAPEWLVGAPGGNRVDVRDGETLTLLTSWRAGTGRFGAALATDGVAVYVGAPMAGTDAQGAVWSCDPPTGVCTLLETGLNLQDQLGFAIAWGGQNLFIGAPGGPGTAGSVVIR